MINTEERDAVTNIKQDIGAEKLEQLKITHRDARLDSLINSLLLKLIK